MRYMLQRSIAESYPTNRRRTVQTLTFAHQTVSIIRCIFSNLHYIDNYQFKQFTLERMQLLRMKYTGCIVVSTAVNFFKFIILYTECGKKAARGFLPISQERLEI